MDKQQVHLRLPNILIKALDKLADKEKRSRANMIEVLLHKIVTEELKDN